MAYTPQIYYPGSYQQAYQPNYAQMQPQQMQNTPQPQSNQGLIWVSGEVGAKSYLVAPNSTVMLMDSEAETFYLKTTDNSGMPSLRVFDYKERTNAPLNNVQGQISANNNLSEQFVTREEYNALNGKYEELVQRVAELQRPKKTVKKEEADSNE